MQADQDITILDLWRYLVQRRVLALACVALGALTGLALSLAEPRTHAVEAVLRLRTFSPVHPSITSVQSFVGLAESRGNVDVAGLVGTMNADKIRAIFGPEAGAVTRAKLEDARAGKGHFRLLIQTTRPDRAVETLEAAVAYLNSLPALKNELELDRQLVEQELRLIDDALAEYERLRGPVEQRLAQSSAAQMGFNPLEFRIDGMNLKLRRMQLAGWANELMPGGSLSLASGPVVSERATRPQIALNTGTGAFSGALLALVLITGLGIASDSRRRVGTAK